MSAAPSRSRWGALPRSPWVLVAASLAYFAFCVGAALRKPFWYDELYTLYVAQLPDSATIFAALRGGMDNHPPLSYLLCHYSLALVGHAQLGLRLPSIVAVWIGLVALHRFAAARTSPEAGACAVLLVASSVVFPYAVEARGYALVFSGACLTLLAWQRCLAEARGRWAPLLLFLALTATVQAHLYAILVLVPLALAELVRAVDRRRLDWPVAIAVGASALNVAPLYWFAKQANAGFALHFWARPGGIGSVVKAYDELFEGLWLPVAAALVLIVCRAAWLGRGAAPVPKAEGAPRWELVGALGLILVPCVMWVLAKLVTQVFYFRYSLITDVGVALIFAAGIAFFADREAALLAALALALLLPSPLLRQREGELLSAASVKKDIAYASALAERSGELVVYDSPLDFLPLYHYAPPAAASRFYYLTDPDAELRLCDHDSFSRGYVGLQRYRDVHAVELRSFFAAHRRFTLMSRSSGLTFVIQQILAEPGARLELISTEGGRQAFEVTLPVMGEPPVAP